MRLSLRPSVHSFVRPSVMKEFFFSPKSLMVFQGSLKGVSMKYQGCFIEVSRVEIFKGVSRKFRDSFKEDGRVF